ERRFAEAMGEHDALMAALRGRDAGAAERIWRRHLLRTGQTVIAVIGQGQGQVEGQGVGQGQVEGQGQPG
ncbi:MAG: hypothetical protein AAFV86_23825, partial [Pseudomonadota bacterium]